MMTTPTNWTQAHCSSCGNTSAEDVANTYSGCCNKRVCHNLSGADCCGAYRRAHEGPAPSITVTWTVSTGPDDATERSETVDPRSYEAIDLLAGIAEDETMRPDAIEGTPTELALLDGTIRKYHASDHLGGDWRTLWREQAV